MAINITKKAPTDMKTVGELGHVLTALSKEKGEKVWVTGSNIPQVDRIPTGMFEFDMKTGGGFPRGRYTILYGPEGCLDKDTFIQYEIRTSSGHRQNHKGGTIERLWHRFHGKPMPGKGAYQRKSTIDSEFFASCVNEEGRIFQNLILDVVKTGIKPCFEITTESGLSLVATGDHKFFIGTGYAPLSSLTVGASIFIHNSSSNIPNHNRHN